MNLNKNNKEIRRKITAKSTTGSMFKKITPNNTSWGSVADWYDDSIEREGSYHRDLILPNLLRLVTAKSGEKIIDIACGQGFFSRELARVGAITTGADISPELIAIGRERSKDLKNLKINYLVAPADKIPMPNGEFDKAIIVLALQDIENLSGVINEAGRVLKTGGVCIISVPNKYSLCRAPYKIAHKILGRKYPTDEPSKKEMLRLLQSNGFEVIERKINDGLIYLPNFLDKIIGRITYHLVERLFSLFGENPFSNVMLFVSKKTGQ